jgi:hypothetical protein
MRAVVQLIRTYFTATPLMRGLAALGLVCVVLGMSGYVYMPSWTLGTGMRTEPLWYQTVVLGLPWFGLILLFSASVLMPVIVERIALGRLIRVLPGGRLRLLASALCLAALLALLTATAATIAFRGYPIEVHLSRIFFRTLLMAFVDFGLMYAALWIVSKTSGLWRLMGALFIIVGITLPLRYIGGIPPVTGLEWAGLVGWSAFAAILLAGGRLRHALHALGAEAVGLGRRLLPPLHYRAGAETDLLLGTTRPWIVAVGQIVPVAAAAWFIPDERVWIFFLTLFSAISGAITSHAAARSRRLWLKFGWTRAELFRRAEAAFWRYNSYSLAVLLFLFVALGSLFGFSTPLMALGVPLLVLGAVVSSYLGLMMTRGLGWFEACLAIVTTVLLMGAAVTLSDDGTSSRFAIEFEIVLAVLAVLYRVMAKARWNALDWMVCRSDPAARVDPSLTLRAD